MWNSVWWPNTFRPHSINTRIFCNRQRLDLASLIKTMMKLTTATVNNVHLADMEYTKLYNCTNIEDIIFVVNTAGAFVLT